MAKKRVQNIFEREKGVWYARITFTDPSTGKRRYFKERADNKSDAKERVKKLQRKAEAILKSGGALLEGDKITLSQYLDKWLEAAARPRLTERTYIDYRDLLARYIRPAIGKERLSKIQPLQIQRLYSDMQERGLSPRAVRYTHAVFSSALKQAVKWGLLTHNPASLVELPKQTHNEMQSLSPESAARFLKAARDDRWGAVFSLALITGMRPGEYLGLQWKDIDLEQGLVTVQRTLIWRRKGGGWYFGEPKTLRSRRSIPIPQFITQELREHRRHQAEERLKAGPRYQNLDLVFATPSGGPLLHRNLVRRHFKPILKLAGLPESIRLYDLRHSCATLLLAAQENPKVVSERLGHATITLTLDVYSHVLPSMQRAATEKLESLLLASGAQGKKT